MTNIAVKCVTDSNWVLPAVIAIATIAFTSPLVLAFYRYAFAVYEKRFKYSSFVALFLDNGQVYFGKIGRLSRNDIRLENVYYLQKDSKNQEVLIKLGEELHGPEDFMLVSREHIVFLESLRPDGRVVQAITAYTETSLKLS